MKKYLSMIMVSIVLNVFGQAPTIQWQKSLGGSSDEVAFDIQICYDGGYIVAGHSESNDGDVTGNHGSTDYWVVKLDAVGSIEWQKSYGGSDYDIATSVQQTLDSGYIFSGYSHSTNGDITTHHGDSTTSDYWVIKLNALGVLQWEKSLGGSDYDVAESIIQTADSAYIIAGFTQSNDGDVSFNHGTSDYWIVKLDVNGNIEWEKTYGGLGNDNAKSIQATTDNGYVIIGSSNSTDGDISTNHGLFDYWLVKITDTGTIQWEKSYGGTYTDEATYIRQTNDRGYIISGYSSSSDGDVIPNYAAPEYWIVRTDTAGSIQWAKTMGGQGSDESYALEQTSDEGYIVAGRSASMDFDVTGNHGVWDDWIVKLSKTGSLQWKQCYGGQWAEGASMIHQTADGGYIIGGHGMMDSGDVTGNHGGHDYWVVKLNGTLGLNEFKHQSNVVLFPNPTSLEISIQIPFILQGASYFITDLLGKEVLNGILINDFSSIKLDGLISGIYILHIQENSFKIIKE